MIEQTPAVVALWLKSARKGPMLPVAEAEAIPGVGLKGSHFRGGRREVTILDASAFEAALADVGRRVDPSARRANILVRGLDLRASKGRRLRLGHAVILIHGETEPCERMDSALPGLCAALQKEWRGGIFGQVVEAGRVQVGGTAEWLDDAAGA